MNLYNNYKIKINDFTAATAAGGGLATSVDNPDWNNIDFADADGAEKVVAAGSGLSKTTSIDLEKEDTYVDGYFTIKHNNTFIGNQENHLVLYLSDLGIHDKKILSVKTEALLATVAGELDIYGHSAANAGIWSTKFSRKGNKLVFHIPDGVQTFIGTKDIVIKVVYRR